MVVHCWNSVDRGIQNYKLRFVEGNSLKLAFKWFWCIQFDEVDILRCSVEWFYFRKWVYHAELRRYRGTKKNDSTLLSKTSFDITVIKSDCKKRQWGAKLDFKNSLCLYFSVCDVIKSQKLSNSLEVWHKCLCFAKLAV